MNSYLSSMRTYILVSLVASIVGAARTFVLMWNDTDPADDTGFFAPWTGLDAGPEWTLMAAIVLMLVLGVLELAGVIGMFLYRRWGRSLVLATTAISLASYSVFPTESFDAVVDVCWNLSSMTWGAALFAAYWGPASGLFVPSVNLPSAA